MTYADHRGFLEWCNVGC